MVTLSHKVGGVNRCDACDWCEFSGRNPGVLCEGGVGAHAAPWQTRAVNDVYSARDWLTVPDVSERLDLTPSRVRRLLEDRQLLAVRRDGVLQIPSVFLADGEPLGELRGTLTVLSDNGFSDDEAMQWLLETEDAIGMAPIDALIAGRKAEVRRVAQSLA